MEKYTLSIINNNIPLFALMDANKIILRSTNKNFVLNLIRYLNNESDIHFLLDQFKTYCKSKMCKNCSEKRSKELCLDCRFLRVSEIYERLDNGNK
jgi:hypothetical protein